MWSFGEDEESSWACGSGLEIGMGLEGGGSCSRDLLCLRSDLEVIPGTCRFAPDAVKSTALVFVLACNGDGEGPGGGGDMDLDVSLNRLRLRGWGD